MFYKLLIATLLFILPFVIFPLNHQYFELPKVVLAEVLIDLMFVYALIKERKQHFLLHFDPKPFTVLSLFLLLSISSFLKSPQESLLFGNLFRLQGVFLLWHLIIFAALTSRFSLHKAIPQIGYLLLLSLLFFMTILTYSLGITQAGRAVGSLGEANSLAAVAVFFLTFTLFEGHIFIKLVAVITTLSLVILTGSRSGLLELALVVLFSLTSSKRFFKLPIAAIICLMVFLASLYLPFIEKGGWFENRLEIWKTAALTPGADWLLGKGFGNIQPSILLTSQRLDNNLKYQAVDSAHNLFLDLWIQGGAVGVGLYTILLVFVVYNLIKHNQKQPLAAFFGLITALSFNPLSICVLLSWYWLLGQGLKKQRFSY